MDAFKSTIITPAIQTKYMTNQIEKQKQKKLKN